MLSEALNEIVRSGLLPNPWSFFAQLISTIVLFLFLKRLVWKPMQDFLQKRSNVIVDELESARTLNEEAKLNKEKLDNELKEIRLQASNILEEAKKQAEQMKEAILKEAEEEAFELKKKAAKDILRDRQLAESNIKEQAVDLAFSAAEKLIQANLNTANNQKMIDDFIQGLGE